MRRGGKADLVITFNGETHTLVEWAKISGLSKMTLYQRYRQRGITDNWLRPSGEYFDSAERSLNISKQRKRHYANRTEEEKQHDSQVARERTIKRYANNPQDKERQRQKMLLLWQDEEFVAKTNAARNQYFIDHPGAIAERGQRIKEGKNTPSGKLNAKLGAAKIYKNNPMIREAMRNRMLERTATAEWKEHQARKMREAWERATPEQRLNRLKGTNGSPSSLERIVGDQLSKLGIEYETQKPIMGNHYFVDFYIPKTRTIIECNGDYWHNLPHRIKRDEKVQSFADNNNFNLIWIWEHDIRLSDFDVRNFYKEN